MSPSTVYAFISFYVYIYMLSGVRVWFCFVVVIAISSVMERKVILSNLPEFLDEWTIKQLLPCANLFISCVINPGDGSKVIVETETREHALQVVEELNGCEFLDSVVQARCVVAGKRVQRSGDRSGSVSAPFSEGKGSGDRDDGNVSNEDGRASVESQLSVLVDAADLDNMSSAEKVPKSPTPTVADAAILNGDRIPVTVRSPRPLRCRFCSGNHETYGCTEFAEYNSVSVSEQAVSNPTTIGCSWPDAAVHKIIDLSAGPVIKFFERTFFKEELTRDELLVIFAYLVNSVVCCECGATGHENDRNNLKPLCQYLPTDVPLTNGIMAKRRRMCKRMIGVLRKNPAGKLQRIAEAESLRFWKTLRSSPSKAQAVRRLVEAERPAGPSAGAKRPKLDRK